MTWKTSRQKKLYVIAAAVTGVDKPASFLICSDLRTQKTCQVVCWRGKRSTGPPNNIVLLISYLHLVRLCPGLEQAFNGFSRGLSFVHIVPELRLVDSTGRNVRG